MIVSSYRTSLKCAICGAVCCRQRWRIDLESQDAQHITCEIASEISLTWRSKHPCSLSGQKAAPALPRLEDSMPKMTPFKIGFFHRKRTVNQFFLKLTSHCWFEDLTWLLSSVKWAVCFPIIKVIWKAGIFPLRGKKRRSCTGANDCHE